MRPKLKKGVFLSSVLLLITVGIASVNYLDQKLISFHRHFLYCGLITPEMSPDETIRILKSVPSNDLVYDELLKEVRGNYSDPLIKHIFGGPFRLSFRSSRYVSTSLAVEGSTWVPVICQENNKSTGW